MAKHTIKQDAEAAPLSRRFRRILQQQVDGRTVRLTVKVSGHDRVNVIAFAYHGMPVPLVGDRGEFNADRGVENRFLEWTMIGQPGGTVKVVVSDGFSDLYTRDKSKIVPPYNEGWDAFRIVVP